MFVSLYKKFVIKRKAKKQYKALLLDCTNSYAKRLSKVYSLFVDGKKYDVKRTGGYKINMVGINPSTIFNQTLVGEYIVIKSDTQKGRVYILHIIKNQYDYSSPHTLTSQIKYQDGNILGMFRGLILQKTDFNKPNSRWQKDCGLREAPYITRLIGVIENNELTTLSEGINRDAIIKKVLSYKVEENNLIKEL